MKERMEKVGEEHTANERKNGKGGQTRLEEFGPADPKQTSRERKEHTAHERENRTASIIITTTITIMNMIMIVIITAVQGHPRMHVPFQNCLFKMRIG